MSAPLTWKERNRDEVWKAARERVMARLACAKREVLDYWVTDELHAEALEMRDAALEGKLPEGKR